MSLLCRLKNLVHKGTLKEKDLERIIIIPEGTTVGDMTKVVLDEIVKKIERLNPVDYVSVSSYEGHKGAIDMKDDILRIIDKYGKERINNND